MRVKSRIGGSSLHRGNSTTKQQRIDVVGSGCRLVLVECQENEGPVIIEPGVIKQGYEPIFEPMRYEVDVRIMRVINEVRRDEDPLGDSRTVDIGSKVVEVAVKHCTRWVICDGVINYEGIVFSNIEGIRGGGGVQVILR